MEKTLGDMISKLNLDSVDPYLNIEHQEHKQTISEIPIDIKAKNPHAYQPKMVSVGPNHFGKPHLMPMQVDKQRSVIHFLKRSSGPIESYLNKLKEVVTLLRESYEQLDHMKNWQDDDIFIQLMLIDGVFLFEFLSVIRGNQNNYDYATNDPVFGYEGHMLIYDTVMQDLLMMENQLPYLVLSILLSVSEGLPEQSVNGILSWMMFAPKKGPGLHLLDMYMKGLLDESQPAKEKEKDEDKTLVRLSASKLHKYGIQFKRVQSFNGIKFEKNTATLTLPSILINQHTVPRFLNLKAYELRSGTKELNSYIDILDCLIQPANNVSPLCSQGIIVNSLGSDEAVVEVTKEITKDKVRRDVDFMSCEVLKEMSDYYGKGAVGNAEGLVMNYLIFDKLI
ncbi:hypothetical protein C5167_043691 [Papaver somniferum]|uniref:Uncharacterized protein n=1 Tax=Papaver somniferum TaxID=3469 RepID=A0A4Y7L8V8_PAPSO|nr:UPF0481 protein At3g47200-like [Papaver somniferum]RZC81112.1 hypothetical protein C5167_043691 [Papaver somniferum]